MAQSPSTTSDTLDSLIILNLRDLEAASHRLLQEIQPRIAKAIDETVADWARKNKWNGQFGWKEDVLWLAPQGWSSEADPSNAYKARFYLDGGVNDKFDWNPTEDVYWLTRLCRLGKGRLGFRWYFGTGLTTKPKWKKILQEDIGRVESIGANGFEPEDSGYFFLEVKIDPEQLNSGIIEGSFDSALKPFAIALEKLLEVKPIFDELMKSAKVV